MKTLHFFLALLSPLFAISQSITDSSAYPIVVKGERWIKQSHPDSAIAFAENIITQFPNDLFKKRQAYFVIGRANFEDGNWEEAIIPFQKSIVISQKNQDNPLLLKSLISVSAALGDKESPDFDSVMLYLEGAKNLAEIIHDTASLAMTFYYRSNVYFLNQDFDQAIQNNNLCESILKDTRFEYERALNNYGKANSLMEVYYRKNDAPLLNEARSAYQYAVNIFNKQGRTANEAHARNALAGCLFYFDDLKNAEQEVKKSVDLGLGLNDEGILLNGYYTMASLYEMQNDEKEAIAVLKKLNLLLDKTGRKGDVTFIKEQFSNNEVQISSAFINNKIEIFEKQLQNQQLEKRMLWGWIIALLILGAATSLLIYYRKKNQLNIEKQKLLEANQRLLEEEKKLLEEEVKNLSKTREIEFIKARLEGEEQGRHRIARQIHDGVGGLLISTKWNLESALEELSKSENKVANRLQENLRLQENSYLELRRVMYELERSDMPWWDALQQFCQQMAQHKNVKIQYYTYNLDANAGGPLGEEVRLVVQELITNALKHANATEINIQVSQIDGELDVIVEDNGIGFNKEKTRGGIGMRSIDERVKKLNGKYSIESKEGAGTIVFMDVPLKPQNPLESSHPIYASAN